MPKKLKPAQKRWLHYLEKENWPLAVKITNTLSLTNLFSSEYGIDLSLQKAQKLAHSLISKNIPLDKNILKSLIKKEQQQAWGFGEIYGKEETNENLEQLFNIFFDQWRTISPHEEKNSRFLAGMMQGMGPTHPLRSTILDQTRNDSALKDLLVPLISSVNIENFDELPPIFCEIIKGTIPVQSLLGFIPGLSLRKLPPEALNSLMHKLLEKKPEVAPYMIELLYLYFFNDAWLYTPFRDLVRTLLLMDENWGSSGNLPRDWTNLATKELETLKNTPDNRTAWIREFYKYITEQISTRSISYYTQKNIGNLFENITNDYINEILEVIASLASNENRLPLRVLLSSNKSNIFNKSNKTWLTKIPYPTLSEWIKNQPEIIHTLLRYIPLYVITTQGDWEWEPFALDLMMHSTKPPEDIADQIYRNLASFGSVGSRVPYWEKREKLVNKLLSSSEEKLIEIGGILLDFVQKNKNNTQLEEKNQENWNNR